MTCERLDNIIFKIEGIFMKNKKIYIYIYGLILDTGFFLNILDKCENVYDFI